MDILPPSEANHEIVPVVRRTSIHASEGHYLFFETPFGHAGLAYRELVVRVLLPAPTLQALRAEMASFSIQLPGHHPTFVTDLVQRIQAYLQSDPAGLPLESLDLTQCSPFQRQVLLTEHTIPFGQVRTCSWVASQLGKPRAARAVGNALARNPFPLVIPCHRCIRSDGAIGGFQRPGLKEKLFQMEGHTFVDTPTGKRLVTSGRDAIKQAPVVLLARP